MIRHVHIENYALIEHLSIDFADGFSVITGETGAGKSILVNALSLLLGQRADTSVLFDKNKKNIIEASFDIENYHLQDLFFQADIDYDSHCLIRREITPQGKSRSFVNDTPVNNSFLKTLGDHLVEIHSQHGNLLLQDNRFQLFIIDQYADLHAELAQYRQLFTHYNQLKKKYDQLSDLSGNRDKEYLEFIFEELTTARICEGEQKELEEEFQLLRNAEEIKSKLFEVIHSLNQNESNIIACLQECRQKISTIERHSSKLKDLSERLMSLIFELKDLATEIEQLADSTVDNPQRADEVNNRLNTLYKLEQKHRVGTETELLEIQHGIAQKLEQILSAETDLENIAKEIENVRNQLQDLSKNLTIRRQSVIPEIIATLKNRLEEMNMPQVSIEISLLPREQFTETGMDKPVFLFNANKGGILQNIGKAASGGELSRLMLALKSLIIQKNVLPTIIFDEIDAGVSGEVSAKMANVMQEIAQFSQVIAITHLPQIASKATHHYWVYKLDQVDKTLSYIKKLTFDERITEIAKMISNESVTSTSLEAAKNLLTIKN